MTVNKDSVVGSRLMRLGNSERYPSAGRKQFATLLLGLLLAYCNTTVADALPLDDARASAIAQNPGLAEMQARYEALNEIAPQQSSLPDPVLSLGAVNFPWDEFDRNQENMSQLKLGISQVFPYPGKLGLREDIAAFEAQAALYSVDEMRLKLDRNVAETWWELYFLDRSLETIERNQTLLRQFVEVAQTRYQVGEGLQQDVLLAQLELSKVLDQAIRVQGMRDHSRIRLNLLLGRSPGVPVVLPAMTSLPRAPSDSEALLFQRAKQSRPLLDQRRAVISASESRLELAKKDYYPDFKLGVTYGDRDDNELGQSRQDFLSVMLSVNLPLHTGTRQDRAVQQRSRELAKSQYALTDQHNLVMSSIAAALTDYQRASAQLALFDGGIIPQARQTTASMMAGYQVNQVDFLNLVRSQITLFNYELLYWKSFTEVNTSIARLKAAVGEENIYE